MRLLIKIMIMMMIAIIMTTMNDSLEKRSGWFSVVEL